jgi:proteasome accessory factor A
MHPDRPLVNTRNEPHAAWKSGMSRLHVICHDNNLCPVACVIKVGLLSIILCMIEAGEMPEDLLLADPLGASVCFSHDTGFSAKVARMDGREATSLDMLEGFVEAAQKFAADGRLEGIVRDWELILRLSAETVGQLRARDYPALARRLDGFLKLALLKEAMQTHGLGWRSPGTKMLDHLYSSLDDDGLYWACARDGMVEQLVSDEAIEHFRHHPPADTRAATRAKLLQLIPADAIRRVDWGAILYELTDENNRRRFFSINMPDPAKCLDPASPLARATTFQDFVGLMHPLSSKAWNAA